jgi:RNA polymerase sigma-70 factor (ECF subfamily)
MHFQGFKYKEIADELKIPIGTVKSRIFIARKKLMDALPDYNFSAN